MRYVRIIHPHHPLTGQIVKVLRLASDLAGTERSWIIEGPAGQHVKVRQSWTAPGGGPEPEPPAEGGLWLDLTSLHNLVTVVQYLQTKSKEVSVDATVSAVASSTETKSVVSAVERQPANLGGVASDPPTGGNQAAGQPAAAAVDQPATSLTGGDV